MNFLKRLLFRWRVRRIGRMSQRLTAQISSGDRLAGSDLAGVNGVLWYANGLIQAALAKGATAGGVDPAPAPVPVDPNKPTPAPSGVSWLSLGSGLLSLVNSAVLVAMFALPHMQGCSLPNPFGPHNPPAPIPVPPAPLPDGSHIHVTAIIDQSQQTPALAALLEDMKLQADIAAKGATWRLYDVNHPAVAPLKVVVQAVGVPCLVIQVRGPDDKALPPGRTDRVVKMPMTEAGILAEVH